MTEPTTRATRIDTLLPWLLHWTIEDERLGGFRSDAYLLRGPGGQVLVDPLPLDDRLEDELGHVTHIFLTHGNHQRSAWRYRRELGALVLAPAGATDLDEEPDVRYDEATPLPLGLRAVRAAAFEGACYLVYQHSDGTRALFCGDLICHDEGGPYRFPEQPGYFDTAAGREDALRLSGLSATVLCPAHALPTLEGCEPALRGAIERASAH